MDHFPEDGDRDAPPQLPLGCYLAITVVFAVGLAIGFLYLVSLVLNWAVEISA